MSTTTAPLRILIVDDEPLARGLIREYLAKHPDLTIVGESEHEWHLHKPRDVEVTGVST